MNKTAKPFSLQGCAQRNFQQINDLLMNASLSCIRDALSPMYRSSYWFIPLLTHVLPIFLILNGSYLFSPMYCSFRKTRYYTCICILTHVLHASAQIRLLDILENLKRTQDRLQSLSVEATLSELAETKNIGHLRLSFM